MYVHTAVLPLLPPARSEHQGLLLPAHGTQCDRLQRATAAGGPAGRVERGRWCVCVCVCLCVCVRARARVRQGPWFIATYYPERISRTEWKGMSQRSVVLAYFCL